MADVAANEAQHALAEGGPHCAARARIVHELVDDEVAVLADAEGAAVEEGELGGAAALGRDAILEEDVAAGPQGPRGLPRRATGRRRVGRSHSPDDLLGEARPGHQDEGRGA